MELKDLRSRIDTIDDQLVKLFVERMSISAQVADYKKANGLPVLMPKREEEKLIAVGEKAGDALSSYTQALYRTLFALSRQYQNQHMQK